MLIGAHCIGCFSKSVKGQGHMPQDILNLSFKKLKVDSGLPGSCFTGSKLSSCKSFSRTIMW